VIGILKLHIYHISGIPMLFDEKSGNSNLLEGANGGAGGKARPAIFRIF